MIRGCFSLVLFTGLTFNLYAQDTFLSNAFNNYQKEHLQEKIYAHTDKSSYMAGEIMWFKLYYVDGSSHKLLNVSKVAYAEVLNQSKQPVLQAKIELKEGTGKGSFYLPVSIASGNYTVRFYTNWMKNYGADFYFEKPITIVNTLKSETAADAEKAPEYSIQFFPEGGNLVEGLKSRIAFKMTDQNGKGGAFKGVIINQKKDTLVRFQPSAYGMGSFYLNPGASDHYKALITVPGQKKEISADLPAAYSSGYVMQVSDASASEVTVDIQTAGIPGDSVFLFIYSRQQLNVIRAAILSEGRAGFRIRKDQIGEGISHFTIFNQARQPVCERLYFKKPVHKLLINASTDQKEYGSRKNVQIGLTGRDEEDRPVTANMSVSVYRADILNTHADSSGIFNYLWLGSELKGRIENPQFYTDNTDPEATDNLMLTNGWSRFKWEDILQNKKPVFTFLPEFEGHVIKGRLFNPITKTPVADSMVYLSVPGKRIQLYASKSKANGELTFYTRDFYGPNELIVQTDHRTDSLSAIEIQSPFSDSYSSVSVPPFNYSAFSAPALLQESLDMQLRNVYMGDSLKREYYPAKRTDSLFKPTGTYLLDNYTRFNTVEEILREYVPEIIVSMRRNSYVPEIINLEVPDHTFHLENSPLVLVDGVPLFNDNKIFHYDPLKLQKLETVNRNYFSGQLMANGIISFTTYKGDLSGLELDPRAVVIDYEGLQLNREFYSPVYDRDPQDRIPDFRTTIFWSPDIHTDAEGKAAFSFYTSDLAGKYIGVIEGIGPEGRAGSDLFEFTVHP